MHNDFLTIEVLGKQYQVRPTFKSASIIETRTKRPLAQVIYNAGNLLSVTDLHNVLCGAMLGNGHDVDELLLGEAVIADYATSQTPLIKSIQDFGNAFFPKIENDGTKKAKATKQKAG